jgi:hypothetical protein
MRRNLTRGELSFDSVLKEPLDLSGLLQKKSARRHLVKRSRPRHKPAGGAYDIVD